MDAKKVSDAIQAQATGYLSDFQGQSEPHRDVLSGKHKQSPVLPPIMAKIEQGECGIHDLGRGYKHTPHAAPGVLFKYIVHRINNVDKYHSAVEGHKLDHEFMASVRSGGAAEQNHLITPRHLNRWLNLNPQLVEQAMANHDELLKKLPESGLNIRKINSEPYVAMTRGLDSPTMGPEMSLASFSDMEDSGFGGWMHHTWMPLKDLWYAFPYAPQLVWGDHGHENEWLFSNSGDRFQADIKDIKPSVFAKRLDHIETPAGVLTLDRNEPVPDKTPEELKASATLDSERFYRTATHPSFNDAVGSHLVQLALSSPAPERYLPIVAMAGEPSMALHKALIEALDKGPDESPFLPAKTVGACFYANKGAASARGFNNAANTERYLRALADYFGRFEDAESPWNAYHMVVCSGRINDTTATTLATIGKTNKNLPGLTSDQTGGLLEEMARFNQHLTQRQLLVLSAVPACANGLLTRNTPLAAAVQEGIAKSADERSLLSLASREDLAHTVADELLKRFKHHGNPTLGVTLIARNPRIPVELLKKHLTADTNSDYAHALQAGIQERGVERANIVKQPPVGGME